MTDHRQRSAHKVVVSISRVGESQVYDVELPTDLPLSQLTAVVAQALGWHEDSFGRPVAHEVAVYPDGRKLSAEDSLSQAGVWDGAWLVFHPVAALCLPSPQRAPEAEPSAPSPVIRWRPLTLVPSGESDREGER